MLVTYKYLFVTHIYMYICEFIFILEMCISAPCFLQGLAYHTGDMVENPLCYSRTYSEWFPDLDSGTT